MPLNPLSTQIVGSYTKPKWLLRHERMAAFDDSAWRPDPDVVQPAREDAVRLAIYDQEKAGLDILTDGEAQRTAYDRHFFARLDGVSVTDLVSVAVASRDTSFRKRRKEGLEEHEGLFRMRPRIVGPVGWPGPLCLDELRFARQQTSRPIKVTVVGPLTAVDRLADEHYGDPEAAAMAIAGALNRELLALQAAGADVLQIDEPMFHFKAEAAARFGCAAVNRMTDGITIPVILHICYGYAYISESKTADPGYGNVLAMAAGCNITGISLEYEQPGHEPDILRHCGDKHVLIGLLNLGTQEIETPAHIAARLREALDVIPPERLHPCSDCGMWFLPREVAFGKIRSLVAGTETVRQQLGQPAS